MMSDELKNAIDISIKFAQLLIAIAGATWAYFRFIYEGTLRKRIQFGVKCQFLGPHNDEFIAQFSILAHNKGLVRHSFPSIKLRVRGIKQTDNLVYWENRMPRLEFGNKLFEAEVINPRYEYFFVEPGVEQTITYITKIPSYYKFIVARAEFNYDRLNPHNCESVFEVPRADPQPKNLTQS